MTLFGTGGRFFYLLFLLAVFCGGCRFHPSIELKPRDPSIDTVWIEGVLREIVGRLAGDIGERNVYHPAKLEEAADWIEERFRSFGSGQVKRIPFTVTSDRSPPPAVSIASNIEAIFPGTDAGGGMLVIGAHYDTKVGMLDWHDHDHPAPDLLGTPGANDNGSGVAALLAIASEIAKHRFRNTVRFVAFANEEPPFYQTDSMGSLVYAKDLDARGIRRLRMISLETLGCYSYRSNEKRPGGAGFIGLPRDPNYVALLSNLGSRSWANAFAAKLATHSRVDVRAVSFPAVVKSVAWSDDWSFWQLGYPAFSVTDTAFLWADHYHETSDTPETLDYSVMAEVAAALTETIREMLDDPALGAS